MNNLIRATLLIFPFFAISSTLEAKLVTQEVDYKDKGVSLRGYLVYDDKLEGKRSGVLVVHEWWGHNSYARKRAEMLAKMGYTAFAVDMYGKGILAKHPKDAGKFSGQFNKNPGLAKSRFMAAYKVLQTHKTVGSTKIAAIGYCFGGRIVLEMARAGINLKAVASFHGSPVTANPAKKAKFVAKVRFYHGASDPFVKPEQLKAFDKEMQSAAINYKVIIYKNAVHSFTNPEADNYGKQFKLPLAYNKKADHDSWKDMSDFLKDAFK